MVIHLLCLLEQSKTQEICGKMLSTIYEIVNINTFYPGIVREREDRFDLKSPTLFIFAENDAVIPLDQVS